MMAVIAGSANTPSIVVHERREFTVIATLNAVDFK
jgi:hypothetical protein